MGLAGNPLPSARLFFLATVLSLAAQSVRAGVGEVEPRIIGGTDAVDGGFAFAAQITVHLGDKSAFCGGSVLAPRWVLTAGHCVVDDDGVLFDPSAFTVVAGTQELGSAEGESVGVTNVYLHPDFFINTLNAPYNDLALLELTLPVTVDSHILPAEVSPLPGTLATLVGWGTTTNDAVVLSETLQEADMPVVSNEDCNLEYPGLINDATLCAGYIDREIDACLGDSGGPLMVEVEGVCRQVGIVSFGLQECGTTYGVYTRLSNYADWIRQFVDFEQDDDVVAGPCEPSDVVKDDDDDGGGGVFGGWWLVSLLWFAAVLRLGSRSKHQRAG